jgi:hypothetical protein
VASAPPAFARLDKTAYVPEAAEGPDELAAAAVANTAGQPVIAAWLRVVPSEAQQRAGVFSATFSGAIRSPFVGALVGDDFVAYDLRWPGPDVTELGRWRLDVVSVVRRRRQMTLHLADVQLDVRPQNAPAGDELLVRLSHAASGSPPAEPRIIGPVWGLQAARPAAGVILGVGLFAVEPRWDVAGLTMFGAVTLLANLYWEDFRRALKRRRERRPE